MKAESFIVRCCKCDTEYVIQCWTVNRRIQYGSTRCPGCHQQVWPNNAKVLKQVPVGDSVLMVWAEKKYWKTYCQHCNRTLMYEDEKVFIKLSDEESVRLCSDCQAARARLIFGGPDFVSSLFIFEERAHGAVVTV